MSGDDRRCPDNLLCARYGTGWPECEVGCQRVATGEEPYPGVYADDKWPQSVLDAPPPLPPGLTGEPSPYGSITRPRPEPALFGKLRDARSRGRDKQGRGLVQLLLRPEEVEALCNVTMPEWPPQGSDPYAQLRPSQIRRIPQMRDGRLVYEDVEP